MSSLQKLVNRDLTNPPLLGPRVVLPIPGIPMCSTRQITDKNTNCQVFEDLCVHSYLDLCISNFAAVTDNPGILNKMSEKDNYTMIPVAKCDFAKLNEIAESLMVLKNLQKAEEIRQFRNKLIHIHNCTHCLNFNNGV